MNSDFVKRLRIAKGQKDHVNEQDFAGVRPWYESFPVDQRQQLKRDLEAFAAVAERLQKNGIYPKLDWSVEQWDENGELLFSVDAPRKTVKDWLEAIAYWDETAGVA